MRWGPKVRERAADLFEQGLGYKAVATELGLSREVTREWSYAWRAMGRDGLRTMGCRRSYSPEVKLAAARARIEEGAGMVETMERFQVVNRRQVATWCHLYEKEGAAAFGLADGASAADRSESVGRDDSASSVDAACSGGSCGPVDPS